MREGGHVVVVGGGLVGSLLATLLVERDHAVTVYDWRDDMRSGSREAGRSINLVITRRGVRALERCGIAGGAMALTVPVTGRMIHSVEGEQTFQPYGKDDSECNHSISRSALNEYLIREAEKRGVRFRFRARLVDADLRTGRLLLRDESSGETLQIEAPVVFGADGAGSAMRTAFRSLERFDESNDLLSHGYKELLVPPDERGGFRIQKNALHIWPRGEFMLMALPNLDASFTATLYLPHRGPRGFDRIHEPDRVSELFREQFPDAVPLIPDLREAFFENPTGTLGTVRCHPWHFDGRALLIGDAAHAIVPFFGQGMNSGFEDCTVLGELLDEHGSDWELVFSRFTDRRKPDGDAIADMALDNFVEMRDRVADESFLLRKRVEHRLEQEIPHEYRSRYSLVMYSHVPFHVAREAGRIQQGILDELCEGIDSESSLDLPRARKIIGKRLTPFLRERGVTLDY